MNLNDNNLRWIKSKYVFKKNIALHYCLLSTNEKIMHVIGGHDGKNKLSQ